MCLMASFSFGCSMNMIIPSLNNGHWCFSFQFLLPYPLYFLALLRLSRLVVMRWRVAEKWPLDRSPAPYLGPSLLHRRKSKLNDNLSTPLWHKKLGHSLSQLLSSRLSSGLTFANQRDEGKCHIHCRRKSALRVNCCTGVNYFSLPICLTRPLLMNIYIILFPCSRFSVL